MDTGQNNLLTLILLVVAVLIFLKLRSVLGRRTGDEAARFERFRAEAQARANARTEAAVSPAPLRDAPPISSIGSAPEGASERAHRMTQFAAGNSALARGLIDISAADSRFDPAEFLRGAKAAYEVIVMAFAEGNKTMLRGLLGDDVFHGFAAAIDARTGRKETVEQTFVGLKAAEITEASLQGATELITVSFVSELITATWNSAREIVSGDPKRVREVTDVWTFAREVGSLNPNWHLVATSAAT